jgi:hypothetical protein
MIADVQILMPGYPTERGGGGGGGERDRTTPQGSRGIK